MESRMALTRKESDDEYRTDTELGRWLGLVWVARLVWVSESSSEVSGEW